MEGIKYDLRALGQDAGHYRDEENRKNQELAIAKAIIFIAIIRDSCAIKKDTETIDNLANFRDCLQTLILLSKNQGSFTKIVSWHTFLKLT